MLQRLLKKMAMVLMLVLTITACSFSSEDEDGTEKSYIQPVFKLTSDYAVGNFLYKDGKQYYIHEGELVEHKPQINTFIATTEVNGVEIEVSCQWYEKDGEIIILTNSDDSYSFDDIEGNDSYVLLAVKGRQESFGTYKLCDLKNNKLLPLFEDKLQQYSVNHIMLSPDLSHAIVSADKGDQLFVYDGETTYPLNELVNGNLEEKSYGARFVGNQILILETEKTGDKETKSAYLFDYKDKTVKKTVDGVNLEEPEKVAQKGMYMYYPKEGILNITNLVTGTTVGTDVSYNDLFYISVLLEEQMIVATNDGKIILINSETGNIICEVESGLELTYSDTAENYSLSKIESDEGLYVAIYKSGEEILIYTIVK